MNSDEKNPQHILLVDDLPENLKILRMILAKQNYRVRVAVSGKLALKSVREDPPDLVLLDIMMPEMNGFQVCEQLKSDEKSRDIPVIFLSALNDLKDKIKAFSVGGVDYITKPFHDKEVLARVKNHLTLQEMKKRVEERNRLIAEAEKKVAKDEERLAALFHLFRMKSATEKEMIAYFLEESMRLTESETAFLHFVSPDQKSIEFFAWSQSAMKNCSLMRERYCPVESAGIWADCLTERKAVVYNDYPNVIRRKGLPEGHIPILRHMSVPVFEGTDICAIAGVANKEKAYNSPDVRQLAIFSRSMWEILQRKRAEDSLHRTKEELETLNRKLHRLATLDGLTQIANRRAFDIYLQQEWRRARREKTPVSLIFCDIDHFKAYNDTYGHQAGDECLKQVAQILVRSLKRPADMAARYGGEEFALILPNTEKEGLRFIAENIQQNLALAQIPHAGSETASHVTLSLGAVCKVPLRKDSPGGLLKAADEALYEAKTSGRNRIVFTDYCPDCS